MTTIFQARFAFTFLLRSGMLLKSCHFCNTHFCTFVQKKETAFLGIYYIETCACKAQVSPCRTVRRKTLKSQKRAGESWIRVITSSLLGFGCFFTLTVSRLYLANLQFVVASRGLIPSLVSHPKCPRILSLATPSLTKFCSSKPKGTLNLLAVHSALFPFVFPFSCQDFRERKIISCYTSARLFRARNSCFSDDRSMVTSYFLCVTANTAYTLLCTLVYYTWK